MSVSETVDRIEIRKIVSFTDDKVLQLVSRSYSRVVKCSCSLTWSGIHGVVLLGL